MEKFKRRNVVLWSGGLDSTIRLHELALKGPVVALSIADHMGASKMRFLRQARARKNYLRFAERAGFNISYQEIIIKGSAMLESSYWNDDLEPNRSTATLTEWKVFGAWILPFLRSGDKIHFGYETYSNNYKENCINELLKAYTKIASWDSAPTVHVPESGMPRSNFFVKLNKKFKIPRNCFSSCDSSTTIKDCNKCLKCYSVNVMFDKKSGAWV
jgi:7-cyano-7-deazaguanine synthase in queuosine biosynthesis